MTPWREEIALATRIDAVQGDPDEAEARRAHAELGAVPLRWLAAWLLVADEIVKQRVFLYWLSQDLWAGRFKGASDTELTLLLNAIFNREQDDPASQLALLSIANYFTLHDGAPNPLVLIGSVFSWEAACRRSIQPASVLTAEPTALHVLGAEHWLAALPIEAAKSLYADAYSLLENDSDSAGLVVDVGRQYSPVGVPTEDRSRIDAHLASVLRLGTRLLVEARVLAESETRGAEDESVRRRAIADRFASVVLDLPGRRSLRSCDDTSVEQVLRIANSKRRTSDVPALSVVSSVMARVDALFDRTVQYLFGEALQSFEMRPISARTGSYEATLEIASPRGSTTVLLAVFEVLRRDATIPDVLAEELRALFEQMVQAGVTVTLKFAADTESSPTIAFDGPAKLLSELQSLRSVTDQRIFSRDVPQADDLLRVIRCVELVLVEGAATPESLGVSSRQVNYYTHAAGVLGLLGKSGVTSSGRQLVRLSDADRVPYLAALFEATRCGLLWLLWGKANDLRDLNPESAVDFLRDTAVDLSDSTIGRRATTLRTWCAIMAKHHYAGTRSDQITHSIQETLEPRTTGTGAPANRGPKVRK